MLTVSWFNCIKTQINVHAAYGSSKDITVYQSVGILPEQMYIVGKVSKKHRTEAKVSETNFQSMTLFI